MRAPALPFGFLAKDRQTRAAPLLANGARRLPVSRTVMHGFDLGRCAPTRMTNAVTSYEVGAASNCRKGCGAPPQPFAERARTYRLQWTVRTAPVA
jgi:hypothetical protein